MAPVRDARAKVNLYLHVTGRRADGYHELDSLFVRSALADRLTLAPADTDSLAVGGPCAPALAGEAPERNLAMRAVAAELAVVLAATTLHPLRVPVVSNVDAELHTEASDFRSLLERQVWSPVRWASVMRRLAGEGATLFVEFGAGNVLTGLAKRILPDARTANVSDPATLEEARHVVR